jgi:murein DD-endopeptidase MepM/ murein hydrolase activator NlpD
MSLHRLFLICLTILIAATVIIFADDFLLYKVKSGDSLSEIASIFNLDLTRLIYLNQIKDPDYIYVGQLLKIPTEKVEYIVKRGDTLTKITRAFKIAMNTVVNLNHLIDPDKIYIGQKLIIPVARSQERYQLASRSGNINIIWPTQGKISSPYGWRIHPIYKRREFHTGIDIAISTGSPIYAAADGVVTFSGWSGGYGNLIIIEHRNDLQTYYGHNIELLVKEGDSVKQGRIIALSGSTGLSTGPHLHFEIRIKGQTYDPMRFLNQKYLSNNFRV